MYGLRLWNAEGKLYFSNQLDYACVFAEQTLAVDTLIASTTPSGYAATLFPPTIQHGNKSTKEILSTLVNIPVGCILMEYFPQSVQYSPDYSSSVVEIATKTTATLKLLHYCPYKLLYPMLKKDDYGLLVKNDNNEVKWTSDIKLLNLLGTVGVGKIPITALSYYVDEFTIDYNLSAGEDFFFDVGDTVGQYYLPETYNHGTILHRLSSNVFRLYKYVNFDAQSFSADVYGNAYTIYNKGSFNSSAFQIGNGELPLYHSRRSSAINIAVFAHKLF